MNENAEKEKDLFFNLFDVTPTCIEIEEVLSLPQRGLFPTYPNPSPIN